jgi:transcriptional regulator with XRE-family HTH domain
MKRSPDTFTFSSELGKRLRDLRLKAGLTQTELARAMGRAGKGAANLVSRLERGDERYPSFGLIADFLRGCRARFRDIDDILDLYTNLPTTQEKVFSRALDQIAATVPKKWQSQVTSYDLRIDLPKVAAKPVPEPPRPDRMQRLVRARKLAAAARRRFQYGQFLKREVGRTGARLSEIDKTTLFNHGLQWFSILYETRKQRPATRESRLAASEAKFARASQLPLTVIRHVQDAVRRRFGDMERKGDLDWVPALSLDEYEANLLKPARKRGLKQEQLQERVRKMIEYDAALKAAVEQVWTEAQPMLDAAGVPKERRTVYRGVVTASATAARSFEPDSVGERQQLDEYILQPRWIRLGLDTALAQRIAGIVLARLRELAKSFPPDPRPKR